ncbi:MAG: hypothetical protein CMJ65_11920 [Planctomycetaceae bacterium]|jgi:hypothetical protein|nr:hypothetical protein [Planctomycetaceae bacterium]MDP7274491.1 hypothetical protein [Planctomycetaceae bacterium]
MSKNINVDLTSEQRELLLRGLNFLRSSVKLNIGRARPPESERHAQLQAIESLSQQLREGVTSQASTIS